MTTCKTLEAAEDNNSLFILSDEKSEEESSKKKKNQNAELTDLKTQLSHQIIASSNTNMDKLKRIISSSNPTIQAQDDLHGLERNKIN